MVALETETKKQAVTDTERQTYIYRNRGRGICHLGGETRKERGKQRETHPHGIAMPDTNCSPIPDSTRTMRTQVEPLMLKWVELVLFLVSKRFQHKIKPVSNRCTSIRAVFKYLMF